MHSIEAIDSQYRYHYQGQRGASQRRRAVSGVLRQVYVLCLQASKGGLRNAHTRIKS